MLKGFASIDIDQRGLLIAQTLGANCQTLPGLSASRNGSDRLIPRLLSLRLCLIPSVTTAGNHAESTRNGETVHDDLRVVVPDSVAGLVVDLLSAGYSMYYEMIMQGDQFLGLGVIHITGRAESNGLGISVVFGAIRLRRQILTLIPRPGAD
jgi:hypothetical protein